MVAFNEENQYVSARDRMIDSDLIGRGITDSAVLDVIKGVRREAFVTEQYAKNAYADMPLPIGLGQTISQPYIVALMTQCLKLNRDCDVLEVGTGSGYQTAVLARLAKKVYTIERHHELSESAQAVLAQFNFDNVEYSIGDGSKGWPEPEKRFDRIIITAAVPHLPDPLAAQLCDGGVLVAPVGDESSQDLVIYEKKQDKLNSTYVCGCRFVKLIGDYGFDEE